MALRVLSAIAIAALLAGGASAQASSEATADRGDLGAREASSFYSLGEPLVRRSGPPGGTFHTPPDAPGGRYNVRGGPGTSHEVVFEIPAGEGGIALTGRCRAAEAGGGKFAW